MDEWGDENGVVTEMSLILTLVLSMSWLWYCTTLWQDIVGEYLVKKVYRISLYYVLQLNVNT